MKLVITAAINCESDLSACMPSAFAVEIRLSIADQLSMTSKIYIYLFVQVYPTKRLVAYYIYRFALNCGLVVISNFVHAALVGGSDMIHVVKLIM